MFMLRRVGSFFRDDWPFLILQLLAIGLSIGLGLLMSWPWAVMVDSVFVTPSTAAGQTWVHRLFLAPLPADPTWRIVGLAGIGLLLKLVQDLLGAFSSLNWNYINWSGTQRVRSALFRKLQSLHLSYYRTRPQGDMIYRLTQDTWGFQHVVYTVVNLVVACVSVSVLVTILLCIHTGLACAALAITPLLLLANRVWGPRLTNRMLDVKQAETQFTTSVQRAISTVSLSQSFGRQDHEIDHFQHTSRSMIHSWWRHTRQQIAYNIVVGLIFGIGGAVVFGYGGYLASRPDSGVTLGGLGVFMAYLGMLWSPLGQLTGFSTAVAGGVASVRRVLEVLDAHTPVADAPGAAAMSPQPRVVEFRNVSMAYDTRSPVLQDVSVSLAPGRMVAFVGESGAGKSTLLSLLPRFHDPVEGQILLDGIDLRQIRLADVRRHVALVLQEPVMLPTTIADNIAYGRPGATRDEIEGAARLAGCLDFVDLLPDGFDSPIAEGGANLSGGQRQRIAIARALLTEAPIIVLDEPTSAQDARHEDQIMQTLADLRGRRTIVIVTHRLGSLDACDQIHVLSGGRIIESGSPVELRRRSGTYAFMLARQRAMGTATRAA